MTREFSNCSPWPGRGEFSPTLIEHCQTSIIKKAGKSKKIL